MASATMRSADASRVRHKLCSLTQTHGSPCGMSCHVLQDFDKGFSYRWMPVFHRSNAAVLKSLGYPAQITDLCSSSA